MKPLYQHHYDKVIIPLNVAYIDMLDYMSDDTIEALDNTAFTGVDASITIVREPEDSEVGIPISFSVKDIDVDVRGVDSLFSDSIVHACEDYVMDHEDAVTCRPSVKRAFDWLDSERKCV